MSTGDRRRSSSGRIAARLLTGLALAVAAQTSLAVSDINPNGVIGEGVPGPSVWAGLGEGLPGSAVYALAKGGTNLYAGGTFTVVGGASANGAVWDGVDWRGLGGGVDDTVTALATDGTNLYAGGYFTVAGGALVNYVAKWNGTSWVSLGGGLNGPVSALVCAGGCLYAGGAFSEAGGTPARRVAVWNGSQWAGIGGGVAGSSVTALAHDGSSLYVGGDFTQAGEVPASRVAKWNGADWSALGSGMDDIVYALGFYGTNVVAGGAFVMAGGTAANHVAVWNGSAWTALGSGVNDTVRALAQDGMSLYAGGYFTAAGGVTANSVAAWGGDGWAGLGDGVNSWVRALACDGTNLFAGGYFTRAGGEEALGVAVWKPTVLSTGGVNPSSGAMAGGYTVTISGSNLGSGSDVTNVTLCGVSVAAILSQSTTQIVVRAGASPFAGLGEVRIFSASLGQTVEENGFYYILPPEIWDPYILVDEWFGVRSNRFGFNIGSPCDISVLVEACTNLSNSVWEPVVTQEVPAGGAAYFSDPAWTNYPARFYRLSQP